MDVFQALCFPSTSVRFWQIIGKVVLASGRRCKAGSVIEVISKVVWHLAGSKRGHRWLDIFLFACVVCGITVFAEAPRLGFFCTRATREAAADSMLSLS